MKPVVLITGGARGLGRAIAEAFSADHAVAVTYHRSAPEALLTQHPDVHAICADLADPTAAPHVITQMINHFGRLDTIINNAGAIEMDDGAPELNFAVNTAAPMALLQAALPQLERGASVVNISSVNAVLPALGASSYSASKGALNTWTKGMARELGPRGIRVNAVAPGAFERIESPRPADLVQKFADMTALGRAATPADIVPVVRFLASEAAGWITGEIITASGGYRL
ncbi:NAD(P)-dependent dehydrogenase (short-subunit alcohol dehydrogenase family) [Sulfitobacter undariae]|uniref:NAD(P)-dependent dehydrogenase (Short-subunit alcohol dehydrogenase family) n=1 Tax=Sulfitobacter undariae TaxID=1563671 RepID=A0A7W6E6Z7_9RHOB|nr:SDR family oxidoreductase [Sulfitobacter undariae]MBB3995364.1 NAD(P)-dependent dehydrogenase (short-subunit alcohol dehydrogenase family) [Sulfitobacter undariae]